MAKSILVVDDSATIRQQVGLALRQAGFEVVEAVDGADALTKVATTTSLIISDVNMPGMGGLEMIEKLQGDPRWSPIPVVMLTTEGNGALMARAKSKGAKGWMIKPFKAELLVAAVARFAR